MTNTTKSTARSFAADARVAFRDGYRPIKSDLPAIMTVFISSPRETVVLVDGKPRTLATRALVRVR